jgi:hypothetical protein
MCTNYRPSSRDRVREFLEFDPGEAEFLAEVFPGHLAPIVRMVMHVPRAGD